MKKSRAKKPISVLSTEEILQNVRPGPLLKSKLSNEQKIEMIAKSFREIMQVLGLDLNNESIEETPDRIARMYVNEVFSGLNSDNFPRITNIENDMNYD